MRLATFRGGPLHETSRWIDHGDVFEMFEAAPLEDFLQASLRILEHGVSAVPAPIKGVYRYNPDDKLYHWEGYTVEDGSLRYEVDQTPEDHEKILIDLDTTRVLEVGDKVHDTEVIAEWTKTSPAPQD